MRQPVLGNFEVTESITTQRALLFPGPAQKSWPICAQQESVRALPKSSRTQMSYFAVILVCNSSEGKYLLDHFTSELYGTRRKQCPGPKLSSTGYERVTKRME